MLISACLIPVLLVPACSDDDDPTAPTGFQVVIEIVDGQGDPLEGLDLGAVPESPYYQDGKASDGDEMPPPPPLSYPYPCPFNGVVAMIFTVAEPGHVRLAVEDIEGTEIRVLVDGEFAADSRSVQWNGTDDLGAPMASGIYTAHLVIRDGSGGEIVTEYSHDMLMANMDPERWSIATSDARGRIVLDDKRLFPYLYDPDPIPAVDESVNPLGEIVLTPSMRFYVYDPVRDRSWRFDREITGPGTLRFVIDD